MYDRYTKPQSVYNQYAKESFVAVGRTRTCDLKDMSLASCQLLHPAMLKAYYFHKPWPLYVLILFIGIYPKRIIYHRVQR